jgi:hypothetical protein
MPPLFDGPGPVRTVLYEKHEEHGKDGGAPEMTGRAEREDRTERETGEAMETAENGGNTGSGEPGTRRGGTELGAGAARDTEEVRERLPRDPRDQQATEDHDEDPLAIPVPGGPGDDDGNGELPGTDEAGAGPRGRSTKGTVHPEHPTPEEPSG